MLAVRWVTIGTLGTLALYAVAAIPLDDPPPPPTWAWAIPVLVAPAALAVYWRPAYRVESCFFLTGVCAFFLGFIGFGWGSLAAPIIGGATIIAMLFAPRDGGWRERWGRAEAEDGDHA
jgi:hypothetical protein